MLDHLLSRTNSSISLVGNNAIIAMWIALPPFKDAQQDITDAPETRENVYHDSTEVNAKQGEGPMNCRAIISAVLMATAMILAMQLTGGQSVQAADFVIERHAPAAKAADTVALNAKIYTVSPKQPWAEAVAIKGKNIVYVGDNKGAKAFIGKNTTVGDMKGKLILPGLVSGHEHPLFTAVVATALYIDYSEDKEKMLKAVAEYIREKPDEPRWSFGGSYEGRVDIYKEDIDKITSDPFLMMAASGHGAWVNSATLKALGVTKGKKAPVDGFELGPGGAPNGYLSTSAAALYAVVKLGFITKEAVQEKLPEVVEMYNGYGFTAIHDQAMPPGAAPGVYAAAAALEEQGKLNMRISAAVLAQRPPHLKDAFAVLAETSKKYDSEMFAAKTLKIHGGSPDGYSSPLLEPYSDRPDYSGPVIFPYEVRLEATMKAAKLGYIIHTHVMGDKAIREALDSFEAVRKAGYNEVRLSTGHSNLIHPEDQPRYAKLNVTCNTFGSKNASPDPTPFARLGKERMKYWQPNKSLAKLGTRLSMSADAPTAPLDPWLQIEVIMLRKEPEQTEQLIPEEGLTLEQAIEAYTMGAAYQMGWEDIIGSIEVGKRADFVVPSQNIFEIDSSEIHKTNVLLTMLNGKVVHEKAVDWYVNEPLHGLEFDVCGTDH